MFSQTGSSFSINIIKDNAFPYLPPIVDINHLCDNNKLLSDEQIEEIKTWFNHNSNEHMLWADNPLNLPVTIIKLKHPKSTIPSLYAIYYGIKPKFYTLSTYDEQQPLEKWIIYIENSPIHGQFKYRVIDPISNEELSDTITTNELPKLKKIKRLDAINLGKYIYDILKITSKRGHTFSKRLLGEGGFGSVRVMQNLENGEWCALKKMYFSKPTDGQFIYNSEATLNKEVNQLTALNLLLGHLNYDKKYDDGEYKHIKFVGIKLIPGMNLMDIKESNPQYSQMKWLSLFTKLVELTLNLYRSGDLHLDIKLENIIFNEDTNEVNFIDFGLFAKGPTFQTDFTCGTEGYVPPEFNDNEHNFKCYKTSFLHLDITPNLELLNSIEDSKAYILSQGKFYYFNKFQQLFESIPITDEVLAKLHDLSERVDSRDNSTLLNTELLDIRYFTRHRTVCIFNEKSMVYTIGIVIAELLDFYDSHGKYYPLVKRDSYSYKANTYFTDPILKKEIFNYLKLMTAENPLKRPTLEEAFTYFRSKTLQMIDIANHTRKIGILNITEYFSLCEEDKLSLQHRLKLMDEIWFVDIHQSHTNKYYQLRRELENAEIKIGNHILSSPQKDISLSSILTTIVRTLNTNSINAYFHITNKIYHPDTMTVFEKAGLCLLLDNSQVGIDKKIKSYLCKNTLIKEQYEMLMLLLKCKKDKLLNKYGTMNRVAQERITTLDSMIEYLQYSYKDKSLTYFLIDNILKELSTTQLSLSTRLLDLTHKQRIYFNNA